MVRRPQRPQPALYKWLKFAELVTAAAIPLVAVFDAPTSVAAVLGAIT